MNEFERKLDRDWPAASWCDVTVIVAVSGGADSVALLRALARRATSPARLVVAHFNHRLRREASDEDQRFVAQLAGTLGLAFECAEAPTAGRPRSEAESRSLRYAFLRSLASRLGGRYVALAHTRDDQVETVLHRILRGTGVGGLAGIPRVRRLTEMTSLVRPLLGLARAEILDYLGELAQPFREDATNRDGDFTRNRIRHELLPALERYNAHVGEALVRLAEQAADVQRVLDGLVEPLMDQCVTWRAEIVALDARRLSAIDPCLVRHLLVRVWSERGWPMQAMSAEKWQDLAAMLAGAGRRRAGVDLPGVAARWNGEQLELRAAAITLTLSPARPFRREGE